MSWEVNYHLSKWKMWFRLFETRHGKPGDNWSWVKSLRCSCIIYKLQVTTTFFLVWLSDALMAASWLHGFDLIYCQPLSSSNSFSPILIPHLYHKQMQNWQWHKNHKVITHTSVVYWWVAFLGCFILFHSVSWLGFHLFYYLCHIALQHMSSRGDWVCQPSRSLTVIKHF